MTTASVALLLTACHGSAASRLESVRDRLRRGDVASVAAIAGQFAECRGAAGADPGPCVRKIGAALAGVADAAASDDVDLGAAGICLLHGEPRLRDPELWLPALAGGTGPGADVLRLAVATRMAEEAQTIRKPTEDEPHARAFVDAVSRAVPGVPSTPARAMGPTLAKATEAWLAASRALDLGQDRMSGATRVALGEKLGIVRVATAEIEARAAETDPIAQ